MGKKKKSAKRAAAVPSKRKYMAWTDAKKAELTKLYPSATREELLKAFPEHKYAAIANQAIRMGLKRPHPKAERKAPAPKVAKTFHDQIVDFLSRARTAKEIVTKFGDEGIIELGVLAKQPPEGYRLREGSNAFQEKTAYLEKIYSKGGTDVSKRVFELRHAENDPAYVSVIFPKDMNFTDDASMNALRIFPIDSSFWGDHLCDRKAFTKYLQYLEKPYAFAFLNGDNIGGSSYTKETAADIREEFAQLLAPVAHKILWAQSGPLEARMAKVDGVDPLYEVCQQLGIYHTDRPVMADVYWKLPTKPVEIVAIHGRSNARKDGAKVNSAISVMVMHNFPHFTVVGNLKEGNVNTLTVRRLDPIAFAIKEYPAYTIICPGFKLYEGSMEEKKGYEMSATGTVVCIIHESNGTQASS